MTDLALGVQLMFFGLFGVFTVLILFYVTIRLLGKIFPAKEEK